MAKKYLLPALKNSVEVDSNECWEKKEKVYDFLIDNLMLHYEPNVSVFEGGSNALPHIFEQMLVFHKVFFDNKNTEHKRAVLEWRAVLSIMALQRVCNVRLDLVRVDLSNENNNPFLKAAYDFRPEDKPVFFNTTWDFIYILRLKNIPIAIFSPITLVCPAKQFLDKVTRNLDNNWLQIVKVSGNEQLKFDFSGESQELSELYKWLRQLKASLRCSGINGICQDRFKKVIYRLEEFASLYSENDWDDGKNPLKKGIYSSINSNIRKEFDFLNNCCDVNVKNDKLRFLVERYMEDVFEDKLLVLVHDEAPDSMERTENIYKLREMYRNVLSIDDRKPIIEVYDNGGRRMASCVFLPFKSRFVSELIQNHITPNEFFGLFTAIYYSITQQMEITLQIKGFPYCFRKKYSTENWQYIYGQDLKATYIWPIAKMVTSGWKNYYIYTEETKETKIEVSVPEAVSQVKYINKSYNGKNNEFQLCKSHSFPSYLCYTYQGVSGFLPIWTQNIGTDGIGSTANIIIDMGHATTSISILKELGGNVQQEARKEGYDVSFRTPRSGRIVGDMNGSKTVKINFVIPDEAVATDVSNCIKNMMHSFQEYDKVPIVAKERKPFEDGQILFDNSAYLNELRQSIVSYINFEYSQLNQIEREKSHIFIEQLLLYAVYQIIAKECSYVRIYFLHCYEDGDTRLGELRGLWNNALFNVKQRTGINSAGSEDTIAVKEYEALSGYVYEQLYKENTTELYQIPNDCVDIGVNIGWKNTNVVILSTKNEENGTTDSEEKEEGDVGNSKMRENAQEISASEIIVEHAILEYAGRNISMLVDADRDELELPVYPRLLQILLGGQKLINKPDVEEMLEEFSELFSSKKKDITHYQGIFDAIAMKIDEEGYYISPDVYNNMPEFRYYLMAVTYNIFLLFLNIGALLKKNCKVKEIKKINLFLGGNGAKFLKWIINKKDEQEITLKKAQELLIIPMKRGIMEYFAKAAGIDGENVEIRIKLADKPEEQLIQGCRMLMLEKDIRLPKFNYNKLPLDSSLSQSDCVDFIQVIRELRQELFQEAPYFKKADKLDIELVGADIPAVTLIETERRQVCRYVVKEITYINDKQYT